MKPDKFLQFLVPKDKKFYPLFCQASTNLVEAAGAFRMLLDIKNPELYSEQVNEIKQLEKRGDLISATIYEKLNSTFITPFDREDIHRFTSHMDTVVDQLYTSAIRLMMYRMHGLPPVFHEMAELVHKSAKEIDIITHGLNDIHTFYKFKENCQHISEMEKLCDDHSFSFLSDLFNNETDGISLIKKRDIIDSLEKAMDHCEDVADVFQTIIAKNV